MRSFGQFLNNTMVKLTWCSFGSTLRIPKHLYRQLVRMIILPFVLPSFSNGLQIIQKKKKKKKEEEEKEEEEERIPKHMFSNPKLKTRVW